MTGTASCRVESGVGDNNWYKTPVPSFKRVVGRERERSDGERR